MRVLTKLRFQLIFITNLLIFIHYITQGIGSSIFFNALCGIYNTFGHCERTENLYSDQDMEMSVLQSHFLQESPRFTTLVIQESPESLETLTT